LFNNPNLDRNLRIQFSTLYQEQDGVFHRPSGTFGPCFSVELSATLESDKFQIEEIDALDFYANVDDLEKGEMCYKKAFSVFNSAGMNSSRGWPCHCGK